MKTMPFKTESQSYKRFKIPNFNPFLSKAQLNMNMNPSHGLLKTVWTQHDAPSSSGPYDSLHRRAHFGEWNGVVGALVDWTHTTAVLGRSGRGITLPSTRHTSGCKHSAGGFWQALLWPAGVSSGYVGSLSCPAACGISLDQGSNPCSLHLDGPPHVQG